LRHNPLAGGNAVHTNRNNICEGLSHGQGRSASAAAGAKSRQNACISAHSAEDNNPTARIGATAHNCQRAFPRSPRYRWVRWAAIAAYIAGKLPPAQRQPGPPTNGLLERPVVENLRMLR